MDVYSAIEKTLLSARIAVKMNDQNTPAVPPLINPGVRDLSVVSMAGFKERRIRPDIRKRYLPAGLDRRTCREHSPPAVHSLLCVSEIILPYKAFPDDQPTLYCENLPMRRISLSSCSRTLSASFPLFPRWMSRRWELYSNSTSSLSAHFLFEAMVLEWS